MPEYRHPASEDGVGGRPPAEIHVSRADTAAVEDGRFTAPVEIGRAVARRFDRSEADLRVSDSDESDDTGRDVDLSDGCVWCDDYEGDHVGQHASSAHPEAWAAYTEGEQ